MTFMKSCGEVINPKKKILENLQTQTEEGGGGAFSRWVLGLMPRLQTNKWPARKIVRGDTGQTRKNGEVDLHLV